MLQQNIGHFHFRKINDNGVDPKRTKNCLYSILPFALMYEG